MIVAGVFSKEKQPTITKHMDNIGGANEQHRMKGTILYSRLLRGKKMEFQRIINTQKYSIVCTLYNLRLFVFIS